MKKLYDKNQEKLGEIDVTYRNTKDILKKHLFVFFIGIIFCILSLVILAKGPIKKMNMDSQVKAVVDVDIEFEEVRVEDEYGYYYEEQMVFVPYYIYFVDDEEYVYRGEKSSKSIFMDEEDTIYYDSNNPEYAVPESEVRKAMIWGTVVGLVGGSIIILVLISLIKTIFLGKSMVR